MNRDACPLVQLDPRDNVAVAKQQIAADTTVPFGASPVPLVVRQTIEFGHKLALEDLPESQPVRKFGQVIGFASQDIRRGDWVHVHNVCLGQLKLDYSFGSDVPAAPAPVPHRTFQGYRRVTGRAATRNYVAVISTVNCSATASKYVAQGIDPRILEKYENVDGIVPLVHKGGCAFAYDGFDHRQLARTLAGFANHPNIGAYLILGLGCETSQAGFLTDSYNLVQLDVPGESAEPLPLVMNIQEEGGVARTVDRAIGVLNELLPEANRVQREPIPVAELIVANECGGSDANSGITANPAVGVASDRLVAHGATTMLAETPEIYGAEHMLTRRAVTPEVGEKLIDRIRWWEDYAHKFGVEIDNNPSVGNKKGGLTTIYEKSLGAIAKGGSTALKAVYEYAEPVTESGLVVMDTPGFDPASVTGMVAGGANIVVFTTGRGSCFGCKPVPTIKVASNTPMYERMEADMDINAGRILDGASVAEVGEEILEKIISVASGAQTKSEAQGIGDEEFCPWVSGPVL
ncbi:MAG: altronate dehydratase family protein [Planctomycetaceae bacterium]